MSVEIVWFCADRDRKMVGRREVRRRKVLGIAALFERDVNIC